MAERENSPAKVAIIREWDAWARKYPNDATVSGGIMFFNYLHKERRDLLVNIRSPGDKWQTIHAWLLREGKVKD
jgi:copper(I)-binding protein